MKKQADIRRDVGVKTLTLNRAALKSAVFVGVAARQFDVYDISNMEDAMRCTTPTNDCNKTLKITKRYSADLSSSKPVPAKRLTSLVNSLTSLAAVSRVTVGSAM